MQLHEKSLGYIMLEHCEGASSDFPLQKWTDARIEARKTPTDGDTTASFDECHVCNVQIEPTSDPTSNSVSATVLEFDGTVQTLRCTHCSRKRTDLSLLFGLVKGCSTAIEIKDLKICRRGETLIACLITIDFPHIHNRSILQTQKFGTKLKELSPALQLLLSIIQSDWNNVYRKLQAIESHEQQVRTHSQQLSFFPPKLSLDELYARVHATGRPTSTPPPQGEACLLARLPKSILTEHITTFLRAQSLENLRLTCKQLHTDLQSAVPGLKLDLKKHQVNSLAWMRNREKHTWTESDALDGTLSEIDDAHRCATGGNTVELQSQNGKLRIRLDQSTGCEVHADDFSGLPRSIARGGLLCDDPGLGKTITVASLILQTAGLTVEAMDKERDAKPKINEEETNRQIFDVYWRDHFEQTFRKQTLLKLTNAIGRLDRTATFPASSIKFDIEKEKYSSFATYEDDIEEGARIRRSMCQGLLASDDFSFEDGYKAILDEFKMKQVRSAKKSFSNVAAKPNSRVAALFESSDQQKFLDALAMSNATLLVVPENLLDHWQAQIEKHIDLHYLTDKKPLVFVYRRNAMDPTVDKATIMCELDKSHDPIVFIDRGGSKSLPAADFLRKFKIVITTTQRFSREYANGSFQSELNKSGVGNDDIPNYGQLNFSESTDACPLLKIRWLRMIVDEGHSMGKERGNSAILFASWISAQRRWCMTGTPTKQTVTQLGQVRGLARYLEHDFFTSRLAGDLFWKSRVVRYWKNGSFASFFRLRSLLLLLMKRHTKLDIQELPPPTFHTSVIKMSSMEAKSYNTLATTIMSNLLLTSMEGRTSGKQDSLLHASQTVNARRALANVRRTCVGYTNVLPTLTHKFYLETMDALEALNFTDETTIKIKQFINAAETNGTTACECCSLHLSVLLIFPCCGGLACPECTDSETGLCPICDEKFDVDEFQRLQPGFVLEWLDNLKVEKKIDAEASEGHSSTIVVSPGAPQPNEPIIRPPQDRSRKQKKGDGHQCRFDRYSIDGKCILCLEPHTECNFVNKSKRCETCFKISRPCPETESKSLYLTEKIRGFIEKQQDNRAPFAGKLLPHLAKIIVFSQFREALNVVGDRLIGEFGQGCVAEYWGKYRSSELSRFINDRDCYIMLLSKDGSEGLDLSFVSHIFFLEAIYDKSLGDQAIARAWRMGATRSVAVETLIAEDTVEETMEDLEEARIADELTKQFEQARTHILLKSLKLITSHEGALGSQKPRNRVLDLTVKAMSTDGSGSDRPRKKPRVNFRVP